MSSAVRTAAPPSCLSTPAAYTLRNCGLERGRVYVHLRFWFDSDMAVPTPCRGLVNGERGGGALQRRSPFSTACRTNASFYIHTWVTNYKLRNIFLRFIFRLFLVRRDEEEFVWFMDGVETCRRDEWFATDAKSGERRPKPAPFDQDFFLILNMVSYCSSPGSESRGTLYFLPAGVRMNVCTDVGVPYLLFGVVYLLFVFPSFTLCTFYLFSRVGGCWRVYQFVCFPDPPMTPALVWPLVGIGARFLGFVTCDFSILAIL